MRGPHVVAALGAKKLSRRSFDRDGIAGGLHTAERDMPVLIGEELAAQVHVGLHRILVFVEPLGRRMPDIDLGALARLALPIAEPGIDKHDRARRWRTDDRAAV